MPQSVLHEVHCIPDHAKRVTAWRAALQSSEYLLDTALPGIQPFTTAAFCNNGNVVSLHDYRAIAVAVGQRFESPSGYLFGDDAIHVQFFQGTIESQCTLQRQFSNCCCVNTQAQVSCNVVIQHETGADVVTACNCAACSPTLLRLVRKARVMWQCMPLWSS